MFSRRPKTEEEWQAFIRSRRERPPPPPPLSEEQRRLALDNARLHMMAPTRIVLAGISSFGVGTVLGISQGITMAALRFRAEHAHKLPTTPTGWFMYHKSKNYQMARAGVREGFAMGAKVSFWTIAMFSIENLYDDYRQSNDFVNTILASLTVAGGFSLWSMSLLFRVVPFLRVVLLTNNAVCRQVQSRHDRANHKDRPPRRPRLRWPAGCHRRSQRSTHWLRRLAERSLPFRCREQRGGSFLSCDPGGSPELPQSRLQTDQHLWILGPRRF